MTSSLKETIREKIGRVRDVRERTRVLLKNGGVPKEKRPSTNRMIGNNSRSIALYHFKLGECDEGRDEFQTAVNSYQTAIELSRTRVDVVDRSDPIRVRDLLHMALLTGDSDLVETAAELALNTPSEYTDEYSSLYHYYYVMALAGAITDTGSLKEYLQLLDTEIDAIDPAYVEDDIHVFYRTWWTTLEGIISREEQRVQAGITDLLAHHDDTAPEETTHPKELVCISATALLVLARWHGLEIHIDSEYIPECVYEFS